MTTERCCCNAYTLYSMVHIMASNDVKWKSYVNYFKVFRLIIYINLYFNSRNKFIIVLYIQSLVNSSGAPSTAYYQVYVQVRLKKLAWDNRLTLQSYTEWDKIRHWATTLCGGISVFTSIWCSTPAFWSSFPWSVSNVFLSRKQTQTVWNKCIIRRNH